MKVIKRNGSEVDFDSSKIIVAITKANEASLHREMTEEQIREAAEYIAYKCEKMNRAVSVEEIQDMVEIRSWPAVPLRWPRDMCVTAITAPWSARPTPLTTEFCP